MIFRCPGLVVDLRKPEIFDIDVLASWLALPEFIDRVGGRRLASVDEYRAKAEQFLQENADESHPNKYLIAVDNQDGRPIGLVMLCRLDWRNRHAECAYIVGDRNARSTLASGDLNVTLYNYLFNHLGLNKVYGYVFASNNSSLRINGLGGQLEGTLRKHRKAGEVREDVHVFSLTRREFSEFVARHSSTLLRKHIAKGLIACS